MITANHGTNSTTTTTGEIEMTTDINLIDLATVDLDEYQVADLAADIQRQLAALEPAVYNLRRQIWALSQWTMNNRPGVSVGVIKGVADLTFGQIESGYAIREVRDIAATLPDPLG